MNEKNYSPKRTLIKILLFGLLFAFLHAVLEKITSDILSDVALTSLYPWIDLIAVLCHAAYFFVGYALLLVIFRHASARHKFIAFLLLALSVFLIYAVRVYTYFWVEKDILTPIMVTRAYVSTFESIVFELIQLLLIVGLFALGPRLKWKPAIQIAVTCAVLVLINLILQTVNLVSADAAAWVMIVHYLFYLLLYGGGGYFAMCWLFKAETNALS